MEEWQKKPLDFGEILDLIFRTIKTHFSKLFTIVLILMGPIYLLDIVSSLVGGAAIFRQPLSQGATTSGSNTVNLIMNRIQGIGNQTSLLGNDPVATGIVYFLVGLATIVLAPVAHAAVLILVDEVRNKTAHLPGTIIKRAFKRYWALLGSSIVYGLIVMAISGAITGILVGIGFALIGPQSFPIGWMIALLVILSLLGIFAMAYFATRWSFSFAAVVFEKVSPGLTKSWRLTKGNFWRLLGLVIVLFMITSILSGIISAGVAMLLGKSALATLIKDLVSMITNLVLYVGYAVVYFDLRVRNEGEDLVEMIEQFQTDSTENHDEKPFDPIDSNVDESKGDFER